MKMKGCFLGPNAAILGRLRRNAGDVGATPRRARRPRQTRHRWREERIQGKRGAFVAGARRATDR